MNAPLTIVLFPEGSIEGMPATSIELVSEDPLTYQATFETPIPEPPEFEGQTTIDEQIEASQAPDTSPTPEGIDYGELPDIPA